MSELITLHGGPADGQQYRWGGGDVLLFHSFEAMQFATYRRSLNTRTAFVFQP